MATVLFYTGYRIRLIGVKQKYQKTSPEAMFFDLILN